MILLSRIRTPSHRDERGFTLVEVLVALVILTVGLIPAFIQASASLTLAASARNTITATYLAQEGIEVIHALRDDNWFHRDASGTSDRAFDDGFDTCTLGCRVQWDAKWDSTAILPLGSDPALSLNAAGLYEYGSGQETLFHRTITIAKEQDWRYHVISKVTWEEKSGQKSFSLDYYLYDWLQE